MIFSARGFEYRNKDILLPLMDFVGYVVQIWSPLLRIFIFDMEGVKQKFYRLFYRTAVLFDEKRLGQPGQSLMFRRIRRDLIET